MSPIAHPLADIFLLGFIAGCSFVAGLFFFRFWRSTRDLLFLAFAVYFFIEGFSHTFVVGLVHPNEASLWLFLLRLLSTLAILGAIVWKNSGKR